MDSNVIRKTDHDSHAGKLSFSEVVQRLTAAGVEYYYVDYMGMRKTSYGEDGSMVVTSISYEGLPPVAKDFAGDDLLAAIADSQHNGQTYRDFTRRAMQAGVQGYFAFLRGKRVIYLGRQGDQHIEWFPGYSPVKPQLAL